MSSNPADSEKHPPKLEDGTYDKELVKKMFMDSPFIDWTRFAESYGWRPHRTRQEFPVGSWQKEKKLIVAENQADKLSAVLFDRRYTWHADVLTTIEDFPKFADNMKMIINARMQEMGAAYKEFADLMQDLANAKKAGDKKAIDRVKYEIKNCEWKKYKNGDIANLTHAVTQIGDFKYRTLMLKNWTMDKAILDTDPAKLREIEESGGVTFLTASGVEFTSEGIQKLMDEYLDKPVGEVPSGED